MESLDARFWLDLVQWAAMIAIGIWMHLSNRHRVTNEKVQALAESLDDRLDDHQTRLVRVEKDVEAMPSSREFRKMDGDIQAMRASLEGIQNSLKPLVRNLERINDYLLTAKK